MSPFAALSMAIADASMMVPLIDPALLKAQAGAAVALVTPVWLRIWTTELAVVLFGLNSWKST